MLCVSSHSEMYINVALSKKINLIDYLEYFNIKYGLIRKLHVNQEQESAQSKIALIVLPSDTNTYGAVSTDNTGHIFFTCAAPHNFYFTINSFRIWLFDSYTYSYEP